MKLKIDLIKIKAIFSLITCFLLSEGFSTVTFAEVLEKPKSQYDQPYPITDNDLKNKILELSALPADELTKKKVIQILGITAKGNVVNFTPESGLDWYFGYVMYPNSLAAFQLSINPKKIFISVKKDLEPDLEKQGWVLEAIDGGTGTGVDGINLPKKYIFSRQENKHKYSLFFEVDEVSDCFYHVAYGY